MKVLFPTWRYGPNGEAQIFQRAEDIPAGWKDHPAKFKDQQEDPDELRRRREDARAAAEQLARDATAEAERLRIEELAETGSINKTPERDKGATSPVVGPGSQTGTETEQQTAPRRLSTSPATKTTGARKPAAKSTAAKSPAKSARGKLSTDQERKARINAIRDAGGEITDDATDKQIAAALKKLEA